MQITDTLSIPFDPLLSGIPLILLLMLLGLCAVLVLIFNGLAQKKLTSILRVMGIGIVALTVLNPSLEQTQREPIKDVVVVLSDESQSQTLVDQFASRTLQTRSTRDDLMRQLQQWPDLDVRERTLQPSINDNGTLLIGAMQQAIADIPASRLAAIFMITDGVVHDIPLNVERLQLKAPLHVMLTGYPHEKDRKLTVIEAPRFGLVGKEVLVRVKMDETNKQNAQAARLIVKQAGVVTQQLPIDAGVPLDVKMTLENAKSNIIELELSPLDGEITLLNNKAVLNIEGVREKLKVLLVSGEPHSGERTWRNLLKADPNVDLIHFTILRPPEKQDDVPINELALIAFPTRELFQVKIKQFDMIILDRYANQSILPIAYYENIARYVTEGGALLIATGPEFAGSNSLANTPLVRILPALSNGKVFEQSFKPRITPLGGRHPITRDLVAAQASNGGEKKEWGNWGRVVGALPSRGSVVMSDEAQNPLLILSHERKGRVGLLLSDHAWLWARGYQGGGPHADMLRRLSHWLMREPDLDEEALRAVVRDGQMMIERQTIQELQTIAPAEVTLPDGATQKVTLEPVSAGLWRGTLPAPTAGIVKIMHDKLTTMLGVGQLNTREFQDVISTPQYLQPVVDLSRGTLRRLYGGENNALILPKLVRGEVGASTHTSSSSVITVRNTTSSRITGMRFLPLIMGLLGFITLVVPLIVMWIYERRTLGRTR